MVVALHVGGKGLFGGSLVFVDKNAVGDVECHLRGERLHLIHEFGKIAVDGSRLFCCHPQHTLNLLTGLAGSTALQHAQQIAHADGRAEAAFSAIDGIDAVEEVECKLVVGYSKSLLSAYQRQ